MSSKVEQIEAKRESDEENDSQSDAEIFEDYDKAKLTYLQDQMKVELNQQNMIVINKEDSQRKCMKAQSVSRKIKVQPIFIINKSIQTLLLVQDQKKLYPELNIQNWEFTNKKNQSTENKTPLQQKGNKNKISQSSRFASSNRTAFHQGTSPINQNNQQINISQQIQQTNPVQISQKLTSNNFPFLDNNIQLSTPQYLPFITNLIKRKRIMTMI
ncbi:unnamed protein product [Paramecium sonneborni]|uniref:Uncharacterized protein n=1 Tax=Paramecium sonneborni TaxID=65129 RepID=A0A8S1KF32_9CILI|nr:unnamed protein product [Paramecium sonneborni]